MTDQTYFKVGGMLLICEVFLLFAAIENSTRVHELVHKQIFDSYNIDSEVTYGSFTFSNKTMISSPLFGGKTIPNMTQLSKLSQYERQRLSDLNMQLHIYDYPMSNYIVYVMSFIMLLSAIIFLSVRENENS